MAPFIKPLTEGAPPNGYLMDPSATSDCAFCPMTSTDSYLSQVGSYYSDAWRNFGLLWAYIVFNIFGAVAIYWLARVPKGAKAKGPAS